MSSNQAVLQGLMEEAGILVTESQSEFERSGGPAIWVRNPDFYGRVLAHENLGFSESYMEDWCRVKDMEEIYFRAFTADLQGRLERSPRELLRVLRGRFLNRQRPRQAKKDVRAHYDTSNEFYRIMLGEVMSYTCGYWIQGDMTLEESNLALYDLICRKLELKPGMRILDAGCGWGAFLKYVAENYGISGVGLNISRAQLEWCRKTTHGLPLEFHERDIRYLDYDQEFDAVASIAVINHIGPKNYERFYRSIHGALKEGGLFFMQGIANHQRTFVNDPFMDRYVSLNAVCTSMPWVLEPASEYFSFQDFQDIAGYYPFTSRAWYRNVDENWEEIEAMGFDEPFKRMHELYLLGGAALTRAKRTIQFQTIQAKGWRPGVYVGPR